MGEEGIRGYHYTHREKYESMRKWPSSRLVGQTKLNDELRKIYDQNPAKYRFYKGSSAVPHEFIEPVIFAFLEPEPQSWRQNSEFPLAWSSVLNYVIRPSFALDYREAEGMWVPQDLVLLSFEVQPDDNAYILDRAHVFREGVKPRERFNKYFTSRVPVFDYDGSYSLPELVVWNIIDFDRLKLEEVSPFLQEEIRRLLIMRKVDRLMPVLLKGYRGDPLALRNNLIGLLTE